MEEKQYIERLQRIREKFNTFKEEFNTLVDELWKFNENKEKFTYKAHLSKQIISDIIFGYKNERKKEKADFVAKLLEKK